eukprot:403335046
MPAQLKTFGLIDSIFVYQWHDIAVLFDQNTEEYFTLNTNNMKQLQIQKLTGVIQILKKRKEYDLVVPIQEMLRHRRTYLDIISNKISQPLISLIFECSENSKKQFFLADTENDLDIIIYPIRIDQNSGKVYLFTAFKGLSENCNDKFFNNKNEQYKENMTFLESKKIQIYQHINPIHLMNQSEVQQNDQQSYQTQIQGDLEYNFKQKISKCHSSKKKIVEAFYKSDKNQSESCIPMTLNVVEKSQKYIHLYISEDIYQKEQMIIEREEALQKKKGNQQRLKNKAQNNKQANKGGCC